MNDPLDRAARALRDLHDGSSSEAASTRGRVLGKTALRTRRRRVFAAMWMPLAAVLVVSGAWAAVTGRVPRLVALLRAAPPVIPVTARKTGAAAGTRETRDPDASDSSPTAMILPAETEVSTASAAIPSAPAITSATSSTSTAPAITDPTAPTITSPSAPTIARATSPATAIATSTPTTTGSSGRARRDLEESLYTAAHQAHFVARDSAAALRAWDEYLAAYPDGRFAPEARYNRALALVRLGRADEARGALAPFADGRSGGYRQTEARALLDALAADPRGGGARQDRR